MACSLAHREEDAVEIDGEYLAVLFGRHLEEGAGGRADAGVGEDGVDATHLRDCALHGFGDGGFIGDIDLGGVDADAMLGQACGGGAVLLVIGAPDDDVGAGARHGIGHAEPDAAIAAGDEGNLARQVERRIGHGRVSIIVMATDWSKAGVGSTRESACRHSALGRVLNAFSARSRAVAWSTIGAG